MQERSESRIAVLRPLAVDEGDFVISPPEYGGNTVLPIRAEEDSAKFINENHLRHKQEVPRLAQLPKPQPPD